MPPPPLPFAWPYALAFWGAVVWAFAPEWRIIRRARAAGPNPQDAGSLRGIMLGNQLAMLLGFALALRTPGAALARHPEVALWTGVAIVVAGSLLRRHCFRMLGESFTGEVYVYPDQPLVQRGAYRWVRHPSYTAGMLMFAGIGVALGNWLSLAALAVIPAAAYAYRVWAEERALVETIGEPYRAYMRRTKRFVPWVV